MPCKSCGLANQKKFTAEMGLHFRGLENIDKPTVWVFPEVIVNLLFLRPDCANSRRETPPRQVNLELSLTSH